MKRKESTTASKSFSVPRPHLDEIERVVNILEEGDFSVAFSDQKYEYESLGELIEKRGYTIKRLEIEAQGANDSHIKLESVRVVFEKSEASINRFGRSDKLDGVWLWLQDLLSNYARWYHSLFNAWLWVVSFFVVVGIGNAMLEVWPRANIAVWILSLLLLSAVMFVGSLFVRLQTDVVVMERRHRSGFWQRNKDNIILLILGSIFGVILTVVVERLL